MTQPPDYYDGPEPWPEEYLDDAEESAASDPMRETMSAPEAGKVIDIRQLVETRIAVEARAAELQKNAGGPPKPPIDSNFVWRCLNSNERGDGILFCSIHRGRFVFDATAGQWLAWAGHHWERDLTGKALAAVEEVALYYQAEADALGRQLAEASDEDEVKRLQEKRARYLRRVDRLRSNRGRENCLKYAWSCGEGSLVITGEEIDRNPWLLPCRNGVVDLQTGVLKLGDPEDYLLKASPLDFPDGVPVHLASRGCKTIQVRGKAADPKELARIRTFLTTGEDSLCPTWEAFLLEIMGGKRDLVDYIQRLLGYGLTGLTREHVFVVLWGLGRNGKGVMTEILQRILGPLAGVIPSEMLLDQGKSRSSAGPSPDIMGLRGLRLAFASETDQGRRFSSSRVKWLSSSDTLTGRNPHDRESVSFSPSHLLFLATNWKPKAPADDFAFWARLHLLKFELSFVEHPTLPNERPIDRSLDERLLKEGPGILAWLVRGCLLWQMQGLNPPAEVLAATAEYRRSEDVLADFLDEKCIIAEGSMATAKGLYDCFKEWYAANVSEKVPSAKWFGDALTRRFQKDFGGIGKTVRYLGLELRGGYCG